jgi:hypothetical protein
VQVDPDTHIKKKKKNIDVRHPYSHCFVVSIKHPFLFITLKRGTSNKYKKKVDFSLKNGFA